AVGGRSQTDYFAGTAGFYAPADDALEASREARDHHRFVTLEFSRGHLQEQLADCEADLDAQLRAAVFPERERPIVSAVQLMSFAQHNLVTSLLHPPVAKAAQSLWYQSKALELMTHFLFTPKDPEFFCMRQKRVARDRSGLRKSEPFQQSILRNDRLLPRALSDGEKRYFPTLIRSPTAPPIQNLKSEIDRCRPFSFGSSLS